MNSEVVPHIHFLELPFWITSGLPTTRELSNGGSQRVRVRPIPAKNLVMAAAAISAALVTTIAGSKLIGPKFGPKSARSFWETRDREYPTTISLYRTRRAPPRCKG